MRSHKLQIYNPRRAGRLRVAPWRPEDAGLLVGGLPPLPSPGATGSFLVVSGRGDCLRVRGGQAPLADSAGALVSLATWLPEEPLVHQQPGRYWRSEDDLSRWYLSSSPICWGLGRQPGLRPA